MRADRGINAPRDLEGKTLGTVGYSSAISVYTRGFLQHRYGVDLTRLQWLVNSAGPFPIHNASIAIRTASGPPRSSIQRLLDRRNRAAPVTSPTCKRGARWSSQARRSSGYSPITRPKT